MPDWIVFAKNWEYWLHRVLVLNENDICIYIIYIIYIGENNPIWYSLTYIKISKWLCPAPRHRRAKLESACPQPHFTLGEKSRLLYLSKIPFRNPFLITELWSDLNWGAYEYGF